MEWILGRQEKRTRGSASIKGKRHKNHSKTLEERGQPQGTCKRLGFPHCILHLWGVGKGRRYFQRG